VIQPIDSYRSSMLDDWTAVMAGDPTPAVAECDKPSHSLLRRLINDELDRRAAEARTRRHYQPSIKLCVFMVSAAAGVSIADIMGDSRLAPIVDARHAAMWLSHRVAEPNASEIGRRFNRDHTSVLHAISKADERRETQPGFEALTTSLLLLFKVSA
jgi:chromosomal replication initiation ATPase DnaA